jgi:hypothetical protein
MYIKKPYKTQQVQVHILPKTHTTVKTPSITKPTHTHTHLNNEKAIARIGPQRQGRKENDIGNKQFN